MGPFLAENFIIIVYLRNDILWVLRTIGKEIKAPLKVPIIESRSSKKFFYFNIFELRITPSQCKPDTLNSGLNFHSNLNRHKSSIISTLPRILPSKNFFTFWNKQLISEIRQKGTVKHEWLFGEGVSKHLQLKLFFLLQLFKIYSLQYRL